MPNWKKVITSGSDAILNSIYVATTGSFLDGGVLITSSNGAEIFVDGHITASGDISASGLLHASLSFDATPVTDGVVVYDTTGGRFYYTGSYGGSGGGGYVNIQIGSSPSDIGATISAEDGPDAYLRFVTGSNISMSATEGTDDNDPATPDILTIQAIPSPSDTFIQYNSASVFHGTESLRFEAEGDTDSPSSSSFRTGKKDPNPSLGNLGDYGGSHLLNDDTELMSNARYAHNNAHYHLLGFAGRSFSKPKPGGGSYTAAGTYKGMGLPSANTNGPLPSSLSPDHINTSNLQNDILSGDLMIGGPYVHFDPTKGFNIYANNFLSVPGSPATTLGSDGFTIYPSASCEYDASGSFLTPLASASGKIYIDETSNPASSVLKITGRRHTDFSVGESGSEENLLVIQGVNKTVGIGPNIDSENDNNLKSSVYNFYVSGGIRSIGTANQGVHTDTLRVDSTSRYIGEAEFDDNIISQGEIYAFSGSTGTYGNTQTLNKTSGFIGTQTHITPQSNANNTIYWVGVKGLNTSGDIQGYPNNEIVYNRGIYYNRGGGGGVPGTRDSFTVDNSDLTISTTKENTENVKGGVLITSNPNIYFFNETDASASISGGLTPDSASAQIKFDTGSSSIQFLAGSTNETLKEVLFISKSGDNPKIGIGTTTPKATFDIKDVEDSTIGTRFLLKSSRTTTGAQVGDSAGTINFAIDSASFNDIFSSGSVAAIDSKVISIDDTGDGVPNVAGNIIFKSSPEWAETLNEISEIGYFHFDNLNPTEDSEPGMIINGQLTVGSGSTWQSQGGDVAFSVHNVDEPNMLPGNNLLKFRITGSNAVIHSGSLTIGSGSLFIGETYSGTNQVEFLNLRGGDPIKLGHISGGGGNHPLEIYTANTLAAKFDNSQNLGIGTSANTAPEKLTVEGNISSSGEVIANSGNFTSLTGSNLQILGTASISYFETLYETSSIIYSSGSTKFGDTMDDFHDFTGSVDITGSIVASNLSGTNTGDQDLSSYSTIVQLNASSSALQTNIDAKASITQLNASSSALQSNIDAKASIAQLNASSSALQTNISTNTSNISTNTTNITSLTDTVSTVSTVIGSDSITNVDTFATSTYTGAIYDYILIDTTVGARAGQFMIAQDNGSVTYTDNSTRHLFDATAPEITAQINGANVEIQITNGNGYTFKSFVKKL